MKFRIQLAGVLNSPAKDFFFKYTKFLFNLVQLKTLKIFLKNEVFSRKESHKNIILIKINIEQDILPTTSEGSHDMKFSENVC